jgi:hypothetical protein
MIPSKILLIGASKSSSARLHFFLPAFVTLLYPLCKTMFKSVALVGLYINLYCPQYLGKQNFPGYFFPIRSHFHWKYVMAGTFF